MVMTLPHLPGGGCRPNGRCGDLSGVWRADTLLPSAREGARGRGSGGTGNRRACGKFSQGEPPGTPGSRSSSA